MINPSPRYGLALIALFKLGTGLVLLFAGASLLHLVDAEIATLLAPLMDGLHLQVHSQLLHAILLKLTGLSSHSAFVMGYVSLFYAVLLFAAGLGLWIEASWAVYLTAISTSLFLPAEYSQVIRHISATGVVVLCVNLVILGYLILQWGRRSVR